MSVMNRRRFVVAVAGAAVVSGCGATATAAPSATQPPPSPTQPPSEAATSPAAVAAPTGTTAPEVAATIPAAVASLAAGEGAVLTIDGEPVAVYKDDEGNVTMLSPKCPHAGCDVAWNTTDKTWDCPCHGSRFNADGSLKNGPAGKGLTAIA